MPSTPRTHSSRSGRVAGCTGGAIGAIFFLFRLLVVERRGDRWQPVLVNGEPVVINPRQEQEFLDKIGKNTNYIIHPDEILADNFVRLVMEDQNLQTPGIIDAMRRLLTAR